MGEPLKVIDNSVPAPSSINWPDLPVPSPEIKRLGAVLMELEAKLESMGGQREQAEHSGYQYDGMLDDEQSSQQELVSGLALADDKEAVHREIELCRTRQRQLALDIERCQDLYDSCEKAMDDIQDEIDRVSRTRVDIVVKYKKQLLNHLSGGLTADIIAAFHRLIALHVVNSLPLKLDVFLRTNLDFPQTDALAAELNNVIATQVAN